MANEIEVLIRELEKEAVILKRMIRNAANEYEYLIAHYHTEALAQVNRKLQTLKNLDDRLYDQKNAIQFLVRRAQGMLKEDHPARMRIFLENQISKNNEALTQLNSRGKVPVPSSGVLDEHLQLLLEKKVRYVKLMLMKSKDFSLDIKRSKTGLKISIPNLKPLRRTYILDDENLLRFITLGFRMTDDETRLVLLLSPERNDMVKKLKIILCKIVFEMVYFSEFEGESFIESGE